MNSFIRKPCKSGKSSVYIQEDCYIWQCGFEAGGKRMIEKALEWLKSQKEEIGISWYDDFENRFRKAMEK